MKRKFTIPFSLYNALLCLLMIAITVLINLCAEKADERFYLKLDISDHQISRLSEYTMRQLGALEQDVIIYPVYHADNRSDIKDLQTETLRRMAAASARVQAQVIDPITMPQILMRLNGEASNVPDGTVFVANASGDRVLRINASDFVFSQRISEEQFTIYCGEARLIGAITQVCASDPITACFISGHGEAASQACGRFALQLRAMGMAITKGTLQTLKPSAGDLMIMIEPQTDLTLEESRLMSEFIDNGGHWLLACGADTPWEGMPCLQKLLDLYGLGYEDGWVLEDSSSMQHYVDRPELISPELVKDNGIIVQLPGRLILPRARAISHAQKRPGITVSPMLVTSDKAIRKLNASSNANDLSDAAASGEMTVALLCKASGSILQLGSAEMLMDSADITGSAVVDASENLGFVATCCQKMTDRGDGATLDAGVKQIPAHLITFDSADTMQKVSIMLITILPVSLFIIMLVVIGWRRRL